jgi:hypothetical protein
MIQLFNPTALGAIICSLAFFGSIFYGLKLRDENLAQFRANLRPGDLCRVKTAHGIVRARIIRRNSEISFSCIDINDRCQFLTSVQSIIEP